MNEAQVILDITAIGISVYTLIRMSDLREVITRRQQDIDELHKELNSVKDSIPKELYATGLEPGVYLPKENKDNDAVDYVKSMDLNDWKTLVSKG